MNTSGRYQNNNMGADKRGSATTSRQNSSMGNKRIPRKKAPG